MFLGYPQRITRYRLLVKEEKSSTTINSRDVVFDENIFPYISTIYKPVDIVSIYTNNESTITSQVSIVLVQVEPNQVECRIDSVDTEELSTNSDKFKNKQDQVIDKLSLKMKKLIRIFHQMNILDTSK